MGDSRQERLSMSSWHRTIANSVSNVVQQDRHLYMTIVAIFFVNIVLWMDMIYGDGLGDDCSRCVIHIIWAVRTHALASKRAWPVWLLQLGLRSS